MKKILGVLGIALMLVTGCLGGVLDVPNETDDLKDRLDDLESRVDALEKRCNEINSNVAALQTIVNAMQTGDYVTNVEPVMENGVEVGYKITFAKASPIVIYHGKDGKDGEDGKDGQDTGAAPKIGIRQDTDGNWYWTLNDEWLLDESGNKVKAVGTDGKDGQNGSDGQDGTDGTNGTDGKDGQDGVTPQFRINEGYWEISYDKGATWTRLGKATGEDGKDGQDGEDGKDGASDSIFKSVYEKDGYVYFEMTSGVVYKILADAATGLDIIFSVEQGFGLMPDVTTIIEYTVVGGDDNTLVRAPHSDDMAIVKVKQESATKGKLYVYYDDWSEDGDMNEPVDEEQWGDLTNGEYVRSSLVILVSVSDGKGNSILKSLNFEHGVLQSISDAYLVDAEAGQMTATVKTNTSYKVDCTASWISYVQTKAIREDQLTFAYSANDSGKYRGAIVNLKNDLGQIIETFSIVQRSPETTGNIVFMDETVKTACVNRYDKDGDGELSYDEAAVVTDVKDLFKDIVAKVKSFDEFQHFISVTEIPENFLLDARLLESIVLPGSLKKIGRYAFQNCVALKEIIVPEGVEGSDDYNGSAWFSGCENLTKVVLPSTLKILPTSGFENCSSLRTVNIPEGVKQIPESCFSNCSSLQSIELPSTLISISYFGFSGCSSLKSITLPEGFTFENIDHHSSNNAFANCTSLETVSLPKSLKKLPDGCFSLCASLKTITVPDGVTYIGGGCFGQCSSLESVTLPSRLDSGLQPWTFTSCESLKSITIPEGVTAIPAQCFKDCISLSEVNLPQSVYEIQAEAFVNCRSLKSFDFSNITSLESDDDYNYGGTSHFAYSGLKSVTFPASVNKIPDEMFENCDSLAIVKLHENITHIGRSAFRGTAISGDIVEGTEVKAFAIPSKVEYIGYGAFKECQNLENVILYPATPPNMEWSFDERNKIYVPDASLEMYRQNYPYYSVLPFSMFGVELKPECSIQFVDLLDERKLRFHINVNLKSDFDYEYGIYVEPKGGSVKYIPVVDGTTDYVYECNKWDMELEDLSDDSRDLRYYKSSLNIGAYMRVDDMYIHYGSEEMPFIHCSYYPCYIAKQVDEGYYMASSPRWVADELAIYSVNQDYDCGQYSYIWVASAKQYFIRSSDGIYIGANADNEKFVFADDYSSISDNYFWNIQDDKSIKNYGTGKIIGIDTNTGYFGTYSPDSLPDGVLASNLY